jgi:hypothetical protein
MKYVDVDWGSRRQYLWHKELCVLQDRAKRVRDAAGKMVDLKFFAKYSGS